MRQTAIPFLFMRGGTSRGPYFNRADLPEDRTTLARVLCAVLGAGSGTNIDGLGGGTAVTTKVAMLSRSDRAGCDVDYFFAQVPVVGDVVDFRPTCGNILSGVGPAAIEMGLVEAGDGQTPVMIHAVNTGARIEAVVQTPGGQVEYEGTTAIDGVPGTAAPVALNFMDVTGGVTGAMLPTGRPLDLIEGVAVTCLDVAMPVVIARAGDLGLSGHESVAELNADEALMARIQTIRHAAGRAMGMGDVTRSVTPKFAVIAPPRSGGALAARYFMPWECHPSMAVTGAQCLAVCALLPGSVAEGLTVPTAGNPAVLVLEHASGRIEVTVDASVGASAGADGFTLRSAGLVRTARLLARGEVMVPRAVWVG